MVGDTHLGLNKSSDLYHEVTYNLFDDIIKYCLQYNFKYVVHLGDFFHDRKELNTKTQKVAHRIARLFEENKIVLFLITGNHDIYYKDTLEVSTLELFCMYEYITVIDKPTFFGDVVLAPWGMIPNTPAKHLFGHYAIMGFPMNNSYGCDKGNSVDEFKQFGTVYSGHFHIPSNNGNIIYLGSPYGMTFHDVNSERRGFYAWDEGKLDLIVFDKAPKFHVIETDKIDRSKIKGNIIKLVFKEDYGYLQNQKLIDELQLLGPVRLVTNFEQIQLAGAEDKREEAEEERIGLLNHKDIITEYVNKTTFPSNIKPSILLNMIEKLKEE